MLSLRTMFAMSLAVALCGTAAGQNLLQNGDFETGYASPWTEITLNGDPVPEYPEWNVFGWGAPEGMFFAMGFGNNTALYQEIEPTPCSRITDFSFFARLEAIPDDPEEPGEGGGDDEGKSRLDDELTFGLVCRFSDPSGEESFIQGVRWVPVVSGELNLYDGLSDLQSLAAGIENTGPDGATLLGVGIIGHENASSITDGWTLLTPEPGTICLLGLGICVICRGRRS